MAITPLIRAAAGKVASFAKAPRSLNEPVTCRFSYFMWTSAPVRAESRGAGSKGVRSIMPESEPRRVGVSFEVKPHAYDPAVDTELFEGVLARRVLAFFIDVVLIAIPLVFAGLFIFVFGLVTLGLGWALYWLLSPAAVIWALVYYGVTLGSPASATMGMRAMDLEMRTWYGAPLYF